MIASTRWPLHPAPIPGEALSSWLWQIAHCYDVDVHDLALDIGYALDRREDIDLAQPPGLVEQLETRTGVDTNQIRTMSVSGWTPWLLDQLEPNPDTFTTYTRQLAVLLPEGKRRDRDVPSWRAWVPTRQSVRACPTCVADSKPPHRYQLMWSLPLMLSCPFHHCLLEPHPGVPGYYFDWESATPTPQTANDTILAMDRRTWQALSAGSVELPRRRIHAGVWFRLLRTLIDELSTPVSECGTASRLTRQVWQETGYPVRAGQLVWHPHEEMPLAVQLHTLEAAATAIHLLESGSLTGRGGDAALFRREPLVEIDNGTPPQQTAEQADLWQHRRGPGRRPESSSAVTNTILGERFACAVGF